MSKLIHISELTSAEKEKLENYHAWQLQTRGNLLADDLQTIEFENGSDSADRFANRADLEGELYLNK